MGTEFNRDSLVLSDKKGSKISSTIMEAPDFVDGYVSRPEDWTYKRF